MTLKKEAPVLGHLLCIRHAACPENLRREYLGRRDPSLAPEAGGALAVARRRLQALAWAQPKKLFSSPMRRCLETAAALFKGQQPVLLPGFRERDFGPFEGKTWAELERQASYRRFIASGGQEAPEGVEPHGLMALRLDAAWERLEGSLRDAGSFGLAAVLLHGGSLMGLIERLGIAEDLYAYQLPPLGCLPLEARLENAGLAWKPLPPLALASEGPDA